MRLPKRLPKKRIDNIKDPEKRLWHLFSYYSDKEGYQNNKKLLGGLLDMVGGLQYHYSQHLLHEQKINRLQSHHKASHEFVAYINRIGQLYYLFRSNWFTGKYIDKKQLGILIPSILALMPIRNKNVSHRQQDYSRNDDLKSVGLNDFGLLPVLQRKIQNDDLEMLMKNANSEEITIQDIKEMNKGSKIRYSFPTLQRDDLLKGISPILGIEYVGGNNTVILFCPTDQHKTVLEEVFNIIELFLQSKRVSLDK